jgi:hypothetical protein
LIGTADISPVDKPCWRVTWEDWRGGVIPIREGRHLADGKAIAIAPALAAAVCAGEAFAYHASDHPMAGRRAAGLSLWHPGADWLAGDPTEPPLTFLPSRLWLIGLGNLGQAFAWLLTCLPYGDRSNIELVPKTSIESHPRTRAHRYCPSRPMSAGGSRAWCPIGWKREALTPCWKSVGSVIGRDAHSMNPALVIAELLRRLHGGNGLELASGSVAALEDFETAVIPDQPQMNDGSRSTSCPA